MVRMGSLFTGIGGFDIAFERAGFETAWQCEIDPHASRVLETHWPTVTRYGDVTTLTNPEPVDVVTFGSPCQDLSVAGKRAGLDGERSGLFFEAMRVIREMREVTNGRYPTFALWENVPGAFSSNHGLDFAVVIDAVAELGAVDICWRVLDARFFGVPQRRRRIFLVADFGGERAGDVLFEFTRLWWDSAACGTTGEGFTGILATSVRGTGDGHNNIVANPLGAHHRRDDLDNDTYVIQDGTSQHGVYVPDIVPQAMSSKWAKQSSGPAGDETANLVSYIPESVSTLSGGSHPGGLNGQDAERQAIAPMGRVRRLTPTECERLQGFPDGWTAGQSDSHRYRQLGNAVAVPVAQWIAQRMAVNCAEAHKEEA